MSNGFLYSTAWARIKLDLFEIRGRACEICGKDKVIHVHHLTYDRYGGDEEPEDLIILCARCHMIEHGIIKFPKKKKKKRKKKRMTLAQAQQKLARKIERDRKRGKDVSHLITESVTLLSKDG